MRYERSMREQGGLMSAIARSCGACGNDLLAGARFCASCGARTQPADGPVTWSIAEKRIFGVVPGVTTIALVRGRVGRFLALLRSRVRYLVIVLESRIGAGRHRVRLLWDLRSLEHERARALPALGDAVYRDDPDETGRIRSYVDDVERRMEATKMQLQEVERTERERIAHAQIEASPTNVVEPEPPIVPEPEPVPHEPPGPVIVPEPEPPSPGS